MIMTTMKNKMMKRTPRPSSATYSGGNARNVSKYVRSTVLSKMVYAHVDRGAGRVSGQGGQNSAQSAEKNFSFAHPGFQFAHPAIM